MPEDLMPEWLKHVISLLLGAGGVALLRVWLENRRLSKKEYREVLLDRVRELDQVVSEMHVRMGNLRVEMAHLKVENTMLKRDLDQQREDTCDIKRRVEADSHQGEDDR